MNDLRKLAEEATPGPWYAGLGTVLTPTDEPGRNRVIVHTGITTPRGGRHRGGEDAAYIAAASPDVILGLLDRIAELEKALYHIGYSPETDLSVYAKDAEAIARATLENSEYTRSSSKVETGVEKS